MYQLQENKECDRRSVGMLVWKEDQLLMIKKAKLPLGFAPPSGHCDSDGSAQIAAVRELRRKVGLRSVKLEPIIAGWKSNSCDRQNGTQHFWEIFKVITLDNVIATDLSEVVEIRWCTRGELGYLSQITKRFLNGRINEKEWQSAPGIEPVWYEWLAELKII